MNAYDFYSRAGNESQTNRASLRATEFAILRNKCRNKTNHEAIYYINIEILQMFVTLNHSQLASKDKLKKSRTRYRFYLDPINTIKTRLN